MTSKTVASLPLALSASEPLLNCVLLTLLNPLSPALCVYEVGTVREQMTRVAADYVNVFPRGELVSVADAGHFMLLEKPAEFLQHVTRLLDAVEFYPEVGWHETLYQSDAQGFERRGFLTGRVDLRTRLRGRFGDVSHLLEPRVGWAYLGKT